MRAPPSIYGGIYMKRPAKGIQAGRPVFIGLSILLLMALLCPAALADTGADTPQITQQPDQLILQLGTRWAGVEFELRTDAGVFPVPVVVDESGVLTMDLGGSTTYTLSCINSTVPIPDPGPEQTDTDQPTTPPAVEPEPDDCPASEPQGIRPLYVAVFLIGLIAAVAGLTALHISQKRRQAAYDEWYDDEDEP